MEERKFPMEVPLPCENEEDLAHAKQLARAFSLYVMRRQERAEGWKRAGTIGMVINLLTKAERAFVQVMNGQKPNSDHFIDTINYAVFALRLGDDLKGVWPWPDSR